MQPADFRFPVRIYYEDTDAGGIVYNANYLKFLERARTEWLRAQGIEQDTLLQQGVAFVVRHIDIDFLKAARFNQLLAVSCQVQICKRASVIFLQHITDESGQRLVSASVTIACVNLDGMRPTAFPNPVKGVLSSGTHATVVY